MSPYTSIASRTTESQPFSTGIVATCSVWMRPRRVPIWNRFGDPTPCGRHLLVARPSKEELPMALYELRTYTLRVGAMAEAVKLYQELGFPALQKGGQDKKLVGYFQSDTGTINQLVHLWKFDDDADRRAHWAAVYANKDFVEGFAAHFRPLVLSQEVKLLTAAPWGPHP